MSTQPMPVVNVPWEEALGLFRQTHLPEPTHLSFKPDPLMRLDDYLFGNWTPNVVPYAFNDFMRDALSVAPDPGLLFGFSGHGVQSWALHIVLRQSPLLIGFQIAAEGIYTQSAMSKNALNAAWELLQQVQEMLQRPDLNTKRPADKTLVIIDSDFEENRWAWVAGPGDWDRAAWQEGRPASFMALMHLQDLMEGLAVAS